MLWIKEFDRAAFSRISFSYLIRIPSSNLTPARTSGSSAVPLSFRHRTPDSIARRLFSIPGQDLHPEPVELPDRFLGRGHSQTQFRCHGREGGGPRHRGFGQYARDRVRGSLRENLLNCGTKSFHLGHLRPGEQQVGQSLTLVLTRPS